MKAGRRRADRSLAFFEAIARIPLGRYGDPAELGRRQHGPRIALVALHRVRQLQLFEQPQDALRARVVEVVDGNQATPFFLNQASMRFQPSSASVLR